MKSLTQVASERSIGGITTRISTAFILYFGSLVAVGLAVSRVRTPNVLTLLPNQLPTLCGVAVVLLVFTRVFDIHPGTYGLDLDARWGRDLLGGAVLGCLYQGVATAAILTTGAGAVVDRWSMGVFTDGASVAVALGTTAVAYFVVAVGEDLLFRGVLIRELVAGLSARRVSRPTATATAVVASALLFGALHLNAGAAGLSTGVVVLQAVVGGLYFGLAYVLTDSLALPVGIHFSTNLWTTVVFGEPDSGYPAAFRLTRQIDLGVDLIALLVVPAGLLVAAIVAWARATRSDGFSASLSAGPGMLD